MNMSNSALPVSCLCQFNIVFEKHLAFGFTCQLFRVQWCVSFAFGVNSVLLLTGELPLYK